jgi:hypothetical protein
MAKNKFGFSGYQTPLSVKRFRVEESRLPLAELLKNGITRSKINKNFKNIFLSWYFMFLKDSKEVYLKLLKNKERILEDIAIEYASITGVLRKRIVEKKPNVCPYDLVITFYGMCETASYELAELFDWNREELILTLLMPLQSDFYRATLYTLRHLPFSGSVFSILNEVEDDN